MEYRKNDYRTNIVYDFDDQNESRADQAEWALAVATDRNGEDKLDETGVFTDVSDLVGNLIHFCARAGLDWSDVCAHGEHAAEGDLSDGPEAKRDSDRFPA
jgi:hypothetical protein